ncbi:MAG: hypothetical protein CVT66_07925 [Actinobacteria bacterium HGW-Actinobacteria-6]|jgi:hypothetical protein|nr:MAG: hypothetical protein CVT66_07925 [Actinobacteria bacterium HGW-Actinobacteria-6]
MEAIKYYVKGAFQGAAETPETLEQQEELIADLTAKVADLVAEGRSADEALGIAIASLGDLSELVAEFAPAGGASAVQPVPTAHVQAARLDFHVTLAAIGLDAAFMLFCTVLGAITHTIEPGAGLVLFALLGATAWWIRTAYAAYMADPDTAEMRELVYKPRIMKALGLWAGACFVAMVMNMATGTDFWFWPVWVAATVLPIRVLVERWVTRRGMFASAVAPEGAAAA